MPAAYVECPCPAADIRWGQLLRPVAGRGEVLVRVEAVAANPVDTRIRAGALPTALPAPFIIGRDLVGFVAQPGEGVTGFAEGQRVWCNSLGYDGRQGSFAQYATVEADRLYALPDGVDAVAAVAVLHPAAIAFIGLALHVGGVRMGDTVLVGGAAGSIGSAVIQMAAGMGARVIAIAHGSVDQLWCHRCGAAFVFDPRDPGLEAALRRVAPLGVDVVWDASGQHDLRLAVDSLAVGGTLVLAAGHDQRPAFPVGAFIARDARVVGFTLEHATPSELAAAARAINQMLAAGALSARIDRVLPLNLAAMAHRLVEEAGSSDPSGRIVLRVDAPAG